MTISPSDSRIFGPQFNHEAVAQAFSDERFVEAMLAVEAGLAHVLGKLEVIPPESADQIVNACSDLAVDFEGLREGADRSGFPVIELVQQLRVQVGGDAAQYVHWGATTQDIMDTARVIQIREALESVESELEVLIAGYLAQIGRHRDQIMAGRTHSQHALPITFGYKVAAWLAPLLRHRKRLDQIKPRALVLQFGGAAGTLASYGDRGKEIYRELAEQLDLQVLSMPWHNQRDGFVEIANWLSMMSGSLAKAAQDILLLAQTEVGELRETDDPDRGGSSAMPQKQNPIQAELILAAARGNAALVSAMHSALVQEQERGTHGLQLEWIALPQMFALTGSALERAAEIGANMSVDVDRMQENVARSQGTMMAEAIRLALIEKISHEEAEELLKGATQIALRDRRPLIDVLREDSEFDLDWEELSDESHYLGSVQWFIDRVMEEAGG